MTEELKEKKARETFICGGCAKKFKRGKDSVGFGGCAVCNDGVPRCQKCHEAHAAEPDH